MSTLSVWNQHAPALKIGTLGPSDLEALIQGFGPLAQALVARQDEADAAHRAVQNNLLKLQWLGVRVPQIIEGQLGGTDEAIMRDLKEVYRELAVTQNQILNRAVRLHPVWVRADAAMAALTPPQAPITRAIRGVPHTAAMYLDLLNGHVALTGAHSDAKAALKSAQAELAAHQRACDGLNKRWYRVAKASFEPETHAHAAVLRIPTEPGTPAPKPIEIGTVKQGGQSGLEVQVTYAAGGGKHATRRLIRWQVEGVDPDFDHEAPLETGGNTLGPFAVGQVIRMVTEATNSSGTRTSAPRTITIEPPLR